MTKSPAFQFYPDKWQTDTRRLSWGAKGIYHELMCVVWLQFQETCSFPDDDEFISSEIGCSIDEWQRAKAELMNPLRPIITKLETNRLLVGGLLKEANKQRERRESLRQNGMLGGRPKNHKVISGEAKHASSGNQNESLPSPPLSPSPSPISGCVGEGAREVPDFKSAFAVTMNVGIPEPFAKWVYDDWSTRGGKDANSNIVSWLPYVTKRWARESMEWRSGTHKGNKNKNAGGAFKGF